MMNPIVLHELAKARQTEVLKEARRQHDLALARSAHSASRSRYPLFLSRLGGLLIRMGEQLQRTVETKPSAALTQHELKGSHTR